MKNSITGVVSASKVPTFLNSIQETQSKKVTADKKKEEAKTTDGMINHGFGVYEDHSGDIWYAENGTIYRNATTEVDRAVRRALAR